MQCQELDSFLHTLIVSGILVDFLGAVASVIMTSSNTTSLKGVIASVHQSSFD